MTLPRLRIQILLAVLSLAPAFDCGSVTPSPDGGGVAGAGAAGTGGAAGSGQAGAAGGGHDGGAAGGGGAAGATGSGGAAGSGHAGSAGGGHDGGAGDAGASCFDLQNQYAAAFVDAQSCTVGASQQCTQLVSPSLSVCGANGCTMYVDDATMLNAIKAAWQAAGCDNAVGVPCPAYACVQPRGGTCVAADGGGGKCMTSTGIITTGAQPAN